MSENIYNKITKIREISDGEMLQYGAEVDSGRIVATEGQIEGARMDMEVEKFCVDKTLADIRHLKSKIDDEIMEIGRQIDPTEESARFLFKLAENDPRFPELIKKSEFLFKALKFLGLG